MELHNHRRQLWPDRSYPPETIAAPLGHEGVGNALRSAFLPRAADLPPEMTELLDRLD